jgi:hypothetical protein
MRIRPRGHTIEIETVARAKGSPRMLLGRNLAILRDGWEYGCGLWSEDEWEEDATMNEAKDGKDVYTRRVASY